MRRLSGFIGHAPEQVFELFVARIAPPAVDVELDERLRQLALEQVLVGVGRWVGGRLVG